LQNLISVLNMTKKEEQGNYKYPPESWSDIPPSIQDQIFAAHPEFFATKDINNWKTYSGTTKDLFKKEFDPALKDSDMYIGSLLARPSDWFSKASPELKASYMKDLGAQTPPVNLQKVLDFAKSDEYIKMSEAYFDKIETQIADPQPNAMEAMNKLLTSRDTLQDQIDEFDRMNTENPGSVDTAEGSAYATTKKVLDDLNKYFPPNVYQKGCVITEEAVPRPKSGPPGGMSTTVMDSVMVAKNPNGSSSEIDPLAVLSAYINDAQPANNMLRNNLDGAVSANQNLSSNVSDELKAKNATLQEFMDIFIAVADALNKAILSAARGR